MDFIRKLFSAFRENRTNKYMPLVVVISGMSIFFFWIPTEHQAYLHDSVYYLAGAESIATGHGYRCIFWEGEPPISMYPPLQSFYLSLWWRLDPNFSTNAPTLGAGMLLLWIVVIVLFYLVLVNYSVPGWNACLIAISTGFNYMWYLLSINFFSDILASSFLFIAILTAIRYGQHDINKTSIFLGVISGLCYLTRTAYIALITGVALIFSYGALKNKQYLVLIYFLVPVSIAFSVWYLFPEGLSNYGSYFEEEYVSRFKSGEIIKIIIKNVFYVISFRWLIDNVFYGISRESFALWKTTDVLWNDIIVLSQKVIIFSIVILVLNGFYKAIHKNKLYQILLVPFFIYAIMNMICPWLLNYRYMLILCPLVSGLAYQNIRDIMKTKISMINTIFGALLVANILINYSLIHDYYSYNYKSNHNYNNNTVYEISKWIKNNIQEHETIACSVNSPVYNIFKITGRKFIPMKSVIDRGRVFEQFKSDYYIFCVSGANSDKILLSNMELVFKSTDGTYKIYKNKS